MTKESSFMVKTKICSILNITPDSFSDGGRNYQADQAIAHGLDLVDRGADMLDIGGESTRPGSSPVDLQDEIDRIVPVIKGIREKSQVPISVDTYRAPVAKAAIDAGADIINDITGLTGDVDMADLLAQEGVKAIVMFNPVIARPDHPSSQKFRDFGGQDFFTDEERAKMAQAPIEEAMMVYFDKVLNKAHQAGIDRDKILLDPGIGFGLTKKENYKLIHSVASIHDKGYPVFLGVSRKRFLVGEISKLGIEADPETQAGFLNRDLASAIITAYASHIGVDYVRVHSLDEHKIATTITHNILNSDSLDDQSFDQYKN